MNIKPARQASQSVADQLEVEVNIDRLVPTQLAPIPLELKLSSACDQPMAQEGRFERNGGPAGWLQVGIGNFRITFC